MSESFRPSQPVEGGKTSGEAVCEICHSTAHSTVDHEEVLPSGIPVVAVGKLIPGINTSGLYTENPDKHADWQPYFDEPGTGRDQRTIYSGLLKNVFIYRNRTKHPEIFDRLKGQVLVDLGAGVGELVYEVATESDAKGYVSVDLWTSPVSEYTVLSSEKLYVDNENYPKIAEGKRIPVSAVIEDMLTFLKRLPDRSVSIAAFGMSHGIISGEYAKSVAAEIERVLDPKGILLLDGLGRAHTSIKYKNATLLTVADPITADPRGRVSPDSDNTLCVYLPKEPETQDRTPES